MNRLSRIAIGALVGSLLTLAIHPASRRFIMTPLVDIGASDRLNESRWIPRNLTVLPPPTSTLNASLWTQAGADMLSAGEKIEPKTLAKLIDVCKAAAKGEANNAYWKQMAAVFLWKAGDIQSAIQYWNLASLLQEWDDYQSRRLVRVRDELGAADGGRMAWHTAVAYYQRSTTGASAINAFATSLLKGLDASNPDELDLRLATLRNGRLLQEWSRSVDVGSYGTVIIDAAVAGLDQSSRSKTRERIFSRFALVNLLREAGRQQDAQEVDRIFRESDAWVALADPRNASQRFRTQASTAVLISGAAGILIGIAGIGLILRGVVWLFEAFPKLEVLLRPPAAPALGVLAGIALYLQTGLVLAAVAVSMCFGFLAFEPERVRKRVPERMGLAFRVTLWALVALFALLIGAFWIGISSPAVEVVPNLLLPVELLGGNTICLSLAVIVLSLLLLAAPGWAMVERVPTPFATVTTLREFSKRLVWGGLVAGVLVAPAAVYLDRQTRESMDRLLVNEPTVYLLRQQ